MFAALNVMRMKVIKKYKLDNDFELSQSYLFFFDKLVKLQHLYMYVYIYIYICMCVCVCTCFT
jgi:aminopeptidase C